MNEPGAEKLLQMIHSLKLATHDLDCPVTAGMLALLSEWEDKLYELERRYKEMPSLKRAA